MAVVNVSLPSGRSCNVSLPASYGDLKRAAQEALQQQFLSFVVDGAVVDQHWRPFEGAHILAIAAEPQMAATGRAFALWTHGGRAVAWGDPLFGGELSEVQLLELREVLVIEASHSAFCALRLDGSVVTWGDPAAGGETCGDVQRQLKEVRSIAASDRAFAAVLADGRVVTWGNSAAGGDSCCVQEQLRDVEDIQGSAAAFAARTRSGRVVTWGHWQFGGDSRGCQDQLRDVRQISASAGAFAALLADGSVVTWGNPRHGGDCSFVSPRVQQLAASAAAFAARTTEGHVVTWGHPDYGGDGSAISTHLPKLRNDDILHGSAAAFAVMSEGGSLFCGHRRYDAAQLLCNWRRLGFVARRKDGTVVTWGQDFAAAPPKDLRVQRLLAANGAAIAALADGKLVTWGLADAGGDTGKVQDLLTQL